jgi:hypothetical protein
MTEHTTAEWVFEAADPEVGFLSDSITHTCETNVDADTFDVQPALIVDQTLRTVTREGEKVVAETTTFQCPACEATTATTEHWPVWMFEEGR